MKCEIWKTHKNENFPIAWYANNQCQTNVLNFLDDYHLFRIYYMQALVLYTYSNKYSQVQETSTIVPIL